MPTKQITLLTKTRNWGEQLYRNSLFGRYEIHQIMTNNANRAGPIVEVFTSGVRGQGKKMLFWLVEQLFFQ